MKLEKIEKAFGDNDIAKRVAYMIATSHEYKEPNQDAAIKLVSNYTWSEGTEKIKSIQGIDKPIDKEKVFAIAKSMKPKKMTPLMVVNAFQGITPQTKGKRILLDGHHRLAACEFLGIDEVPVYKGRYNGKAEKSIDDLIEKRASEIIGHTIEKYAALNSDVQLNPIQQRIVNNPSNKMLLAHSVGSGKTLGGIAKFETLKEQGKAKKALVVVPAGLRNNFAEEGVGKFTNSTVNVIGTKAEVSKGLAGTPNPETDYNVVSYEMFRKNPELIMNTVGADTIIADEVQKIKNDGTSTLDSFNRVRDKYNNYIGLSGSLVSNKVSDLYNLVDVTSKGNHNLGATKSEFEKTYLKRSNHPKYNGVKPEKVPIVGFNHKKTLKKELSKYIDYVGYEDVKDIADMPNKVVKVKKVPLSRQQAKLYKQLVHDKPELRKLIENKRIETLGDEQAAKAFNAMIEARKLMNSQGSVVPGMSLRESAKKSPKTRKLLDDMERHLAETPDGQAILLSNMINGGIDVLEAGLKDRGYDYGKFIGKGNPGVTEESRQQDVEDYKARKKRVMLISGAGAEGISLGDTTWEGVLDGHYNPERMNQMEARGVRSKGLKHRAPQDRNVMVNRYIATMPKKFGIIKSKLKTPDEIIYEISDSKNKQNQLLYDLLRE